MGRKEAYKILIRKAVEVQENNGYIDGRELVEEVVEKAGTVEIASGRTVIDWLEDEVETGNITKLPSDRYRVERKIIYLQ